MWQHLVEIDRYISVFFIIIIIFLFLSQKYVIDTQNNGLDEHPKLMLRLIIIDQKLFTYFYAQKFSLSRSMRIQLLQIKK